jgi:hypothetical protein
MYASAILHHRVSDGRFSSVRRGIPVFQARREQSPNIRWLPASNFHKLGVKVAFQQVILTF